MTYSSSVLSANSVNAGMSVASARQRHATAHERDSRKLSRTMAIERAGVPMKHRHTKAFVSLPLNNWLAVVLKEAK